MLEIPTYGILKKVMFYDVLLKLNLQAIKIYYEKDSIKKMQRQLRVAKKFGADALNDDTLEALHSKNNKNTFDTEFE